MNMKKKSILIIVLLSGGIAILLGLRFLTSEDTWICQSGKWVKHGVPTAVKPDNGCGQVKDEMIRVFSPESDQKVSLPIVIKGEARGNWFFEASFPIKLLDASGNEIGLAIAQAQSDWMTTEFVPFEATLNIASLPEIGEGVLVFERDNPSGLPENDEQIRVPIRFPQSEETSVVKVFFNNSDFDPEFSCNKVFPKERVISKTPAIARAALELLLNGPTFGEQAENFFTSINSGVKIQKLSIEDNIAKVDFDSQLEFQVGGSCRVAAIRSQITETLKQFPTVKNVIISIDGRTEDILQP